MKKKRNNYSGKEKVKIIRLHLLEKVTVSDICDRYDIRPTVYYRWQKQFFERGEEAFKPANGKAKEETKIKKLESRLLANYEWKYLDACRKKGLTAILGAGFDPGVVNAYCSYGMKHYFDTVDTIDIMDVNAGDHGKYFATNFDPEINFREFTGKVWTWIDRHWVDKPVHSEKRKRDFPVVGEQTIYLTGHDELHSLSKNIDADSIRFWMGFSDHYINCFTVLKNIGLLSEQPVKTAEGLEVIPLKVVKACLPDPGSLAPGYTGKTCIGNLIKGKKDGRGKKIFIYNICDHEKCYEEVESQAISYTAGVPPVAAAMLIANGEWDVKRMVNVEELNPDPFIDLLNTMGLATKIRKEI